MSVVGRGILQEVGHAAEPTVGIAAGAHVAVEAQTRVGVDDLVDLLAAGERPDLAHHDVEAFLERREFLAFSATSAASSTRSGLIPIGQTRDIAAWQATMARLDAESAVARQPRQHQRMAPDEVVAYLRSLPSLWADAGPEGRQALASALFAKLEVEGYQKMRYELTPDAVELGLGAALPAELEIGGQMGGFGRGERI